MSTGGAIPYHLRQNKAIERNLFVDLLMRIGRYANISDYTYIGFGGPFLEDFKHLHSSLRISNMVSIEMEEDVFFRQSFNQPISCVSLRHENSKDFISSYDFADPSIVWLDYATPDVGQQLTETHRLVEKLGHGDIFKITLNANPQALGSREGTPLHEFRASVAASRMGDYGPARVNEEDVLPKNYPKLLLSALMSAGRQGLKGNPGHVLQPLTAFVYSDGQQMLTFSAIILKIEELEIFERTTRLSHWKFSCLTGETIKSISVPSFSLKERIHVESLLPEKDAEAILDNLGYSIGDRKSAKELMENFVEYYRLYPWYSRIVV
jgi:hypothetical protein